MGIILALGPLFLAAMSAGMLVARMARVLHWSLFAVRVTGTVIGVREHRGREFVAVYRYIDLADTAWQAHSEHGAATLEQMKTGTKASLLFLPARPETVQEAGSDSAIGRSLAAVLVLLLMVTLLGACAFVFGRLWEGAGRDVPGWIATGAALAAFALGVWPARRDADLKDYGPIEQAEDIPAARVKALRSGFGRLF